MLALSPSTVPLRVPVPTPVPPLVLLVLGVVLRLYCPRGASVRSALELERAVLEWLYHPSGAAVRSALEELERSVLELELVLYLYRHKR